MNIMMKSKASVICATLASMLILQEQANAADVRKLCYKITSGQDEAYILGDVFRQGLLEFTNDKWNTAKASLLSPVSPPVDANGCEGKLPTMLEPTNTNYLGNITNKAKFLRMAAMECGTNKTKIKDQFFSVGDAVYYRNCNSGEQTGYIYFWGKANGYKTQCFGSTYPEIFTIANQNKNPATPERMASIYSNNNGSPPMTSQSDYALGNAMAAIQIAESARDYLVYPINYMLIEQNKAAEQIIGGHCPSDTPTGTCQNTVSAKNGVHPLAWGGAQQVMMTGGGWGTNNGATSDFGKEFEAETTINWLVFKKLAAREILSKNGVSNCPVTQTFANLPPNNQNTIKNFFAPIFY